jgi:hypothetical protein
MSTISLTDEELEIARKAIEDELIERRSRRISVLRNNGLVCKESNGASSSIIRLSSVDALRLAVEVINNHRNGT